MKKKEEKKGKTRGNLLPFLTGEAHAVLTSVLCVVPHKRLFEEMKQLHEMAQGKKWQTKTKKNVLVLVVVRSTGGLWLSALMCELCLVRQAFSIKAPRC